MPTTYTKDNGLGDYIVGQATGASYNFYSGLGAAHQSPTAPVVKPLPREPITISSSGFGRILDPEELERLAQCRAREWKRQRVSAAVAFTALLIICLGQFHLGSMWSVGIAAVGSIMVLLADELEDGLKLTIPFAIWAGFIVVRGVQYLVSLI